MSEFEPTEGLELHDYTIAKRYVLDAARSGQVEAVVKIFEVVAFQDEPTNIRRTMLMPVVREAFKPGNIAFALDLIAKTMPYARERTDEVKTILLDEAAATENGEIIRAIWRGLGFESIRISATLLAKVEPHITASRLDRDAAIGELDRADFLSLLEEYDPQNGPDPEGLLNEILDTIGYASGEDLCAAEIIEAVMRKGDGEIINALAVRISAEGAAVTNPLFNAWARENLGSDVVPPIEPSVEE